MTVSADELRKRTKAFAIRIVRLCRSLPNTAEARIIGNQLLRCGTSVGAKYRAVCRARSRADFISKIGIVVEEADESVFWLELLVESGIAPVSDVTVLIKEANELLAIFGASQLTAKQNAA
jgi:four helix bundle protein